jgi:hypothetical protein
MAVERLSGGSSLIDVLDRILDKGIVIDAWVRISLVGIDLITVEARVVVASIDTYLKYADAVGLTGLVSRPQLTGAEIPEVEVETTRRVSRAPVVRRAAARRG